VYLLGTQKRFLLLKAIQN